MLSKGMQSARLLQMCAYVTSLVECNSWNLEDLAFVELLLTSPMHVIFLAPNASQLGCTWS